MKTEYLSEFLILAGAASYAEAAQQLSLSVSTLSRHIAALEEETGCVLFLRTSRRVTLTEDGLRFLDCAKTVCQAVEVFRTGGGRSQKELTIGYISSAAGCGILGSILEFRKNHPDIRLHLNEGRTEPLYRQLLSGECDAVICYEYPFADYRGIRRFTLLQDAILCALPTEHPLAASDSVSLRQLQSENILMHRENSWMSRFCLGLFNDAGIRPPVQHFPKLSQKYMLELVARGNGVGLCEKNRTTITHPGVCFRPLSPKVRKTICLMIRKEPLSVEKAAFLSFLTSCYPNPPGPFLTTEGVPGTR